MGLGVTRESSLPSPGTGAMGVIVCECGDKVNTKAAVCPHCGKPGPFEAPKLPKKRTSFGELVTAVVLTLVGLGVLIAMHH